MADATTMDLTGIDLVEPGLHGEDSGGSGNLHTIRIASIGGTTLEEHGDYTNFMNRVGGARTTNATQTIIGQSVGAGSGYEDSMLWYTAKVMARKTNDADRRFWWIVGYFTWSSASVLDQVGTTQDVVTSQFDAGAATWAADFLVTGDSVQLAITGQAATTIDWSVEYSIAFLRNIS